MIDWRQELIDLLRGFSWRSRSRPSTRPSPTSEHDEYLFAWARTAPSALTSTSGFSIAAAMRSPSSTRRS
jgi:hypothetical protein